MAAASSREPPLWETRCNNRCLGVRPPRRRVLRRPGRWQQVRGLERPCLCFPAFGPLGPLAWERGSQGRPDGCALIAERGSWLLCVDRAGCSVAGRGTWPSGAVSGSAAQAGPGQGEVGGCRDPVPSREVGGGPAPVGELLVAAAAAGVPETTGDSLPSLGVRAST